MVWDDIKERWVTFDEKWPVIKKRVGLGVPARERLRQEKRRQSIKLARENKS